MPDAEASPILVPRENVNDETATLLGWLVADGVKVRAGETVAQVETSKAVVDIVAACAGVLHHRAGEGAEVAIGGLLGLIAPETMGGWGGVFDAPGSPACADRGVGDSAPATPAAPATGNHAPARFSHAARQRLAQLGLDARAFHGRGLVRLRDLEPAPEPGERPQDQEPPLHPLHKGGKSGEPLSYSLPHEGGAGGRAADALSSSPPYEGGAGGVGTAAAGPQQAAAATGVAYRTERLSRAKRTEAKYLRSAHDTSLPSVVTVACPTRGFRAAAAGRGLALIVFEAARLLRKYPIFNAFHADGNVNYYDAVNVGFAIDADRGLKVPVLKQADTKPLAVLAAELRELTVAYLDDRLPVESLAGGTFTVTDLSGDGEGEGAALFQPLINQGQAAILGVGAEVILPGAGAGLYYLSLAFDHQLAEGRAAARFLNDLRERLAHHEAALLQGHGAARDLADEPCCSRCQATFSELAAIARHLVPTVRADGSSRLFCTRCLEGW